MTRLLASLAFIRKTFQDHLKWHFGECQSNSWVHDLESRGTRATNGASSIFLNLRRLRPLQAFDSKPRFHPEISSEFQILQNPVRDQEVGGSNPLSPTNISTTYGGIFPEEIPP